MCPPAPQPTYIDRYPDELEIAAHEGVTPVSLTTNIQDNITKRNNYEGEVKVYRALERLQEQIIVLHSFKCSYQQFNMCNPGIDMSNRSRNDSCECDFLVMGKNYFAVIEVKNSTLDGNPRAAFESSLDQRNRMRSLIEGICPDGNIFLFTAFPNLSKKTMEAKFLNDEWNDTERCCLGRFFSSDILTSFHSEGSSIIFKEELEDHKKFRKLWAANVTRKMGLKILAQFFKDLLSQFLGQETDFVSLQDQAKHILLTIFCTEKDVVDFSPFCLSETVMKIDSELKAGCITLEQHFKSSQGKQGVNPGVVLAPDDIRNVVGIKYLTAEQKKIFESEKKLMFIIGPAGSGKTVLLAAKMIKLIHLEPDKKVVVFKFSGDNGNCSRYESTCHKAKITYEVMSRKSFHSPSQLSKLILLSRGSVVIVQIDPAFNDSFRHIPETVGLLRHDCQIIIDDYQVMHFGRHLLLTNTSWLRDHVLMTRSQYCGNFILIACDVAQHWNSLYFSVDWISWRLPMLLFQSPDNCVRLHANLRNTYDIFLVLYAVRSFCGVPNPGFFALAAALPKLPGFIYSVFPSSTSGHFIRGPLTYFHVFNTFNADRICNLVRKEMAECKLKPWFLKRGHVIFLHDTYLNSSILKPLEEVLADSTVRIAKCDNDYSYSSEWPAVIVFLEVRGRTKDYLSKLYLAISRARVKCTVILFPRKGMKLSSESDIVGLLRILELVAQVVRH